MSKGLAEPTAPAAERERSPWLTVPEAAARAKCSRNLIYMRVKEGRLRAVKLGARNDIRIHVTWLDAFMEQEAVVTVVNPAAPGEMIPFRRDR